MYPLRSIWTPGSPSQPPTRRGILAGIGLGATAAVFPRHFQEPGAFAEDLTLTPSQAEGPFYPVHLPLDTDNDLLIINDSITPAVGEVTHLTGRILDPHGQPIRNAVVEIWQVDSHGAYLHERSANHKKRDQNFQGFGRFLTSSNGEYYFRTVKPVAYPGRTPHIHVAVKIQGRKKWTTQCYIKGHPQNERDDNWRRLGDQKVRDLVTVEFAPIRDSRAGELTAKFDMVLGHTPEDDHHDEESGG